MTLWGTLCRIPDWFPKINPNREHKMFIPKSAVGFSWVMAACWFTLCTSPCVLMQDAMHKSISHSDMRIVLNKGLDEQFGAQSTTSSHGWHAGTCWHSLHGLTRERARDSWHRQMLLGNVQKTSSVSTCPPPCFSSCVFFLVSKIYFSISYIRIVFVKYLHSEGQLYSKKEKASSRNPT